MFSGNFNTERIVEENELFSTCATANVAAVGNVTQTKVEEIETDSDEMEKGPNEQVTSQANGPVTASQAFQEMFREGYLSDFSLKVGDRTFPVHKSILGVRSKVFRSMFASEMKATQDNCVDIKEVDVDTLERMLQFIYSDILDKDMDWEDASRLYAAADFYALEPLKQGCSTILKDGLCVTNALEVLALSDLHQDRLLKSAALDYISLSHLDIIDTEAWTKFKKEKAELAMETLHKLYVKKVKGCS